MVIYFPRYLIASTMFDDYVFRRSNEISVKVYAHVFILFMCERRKPTKQHSYNFT